MLAQNFKTPVDLGITDAEFDALAKVLGMLERGEIKDAPRGATFETFWFEERHKNPEPTMFRMLGARGIADCGTACCILGLAQFVAGSLILSSVGKDKSYYDLFYPLEAITCRTAAQGAIALRSYLAHGEPRWAEALSA